MKLMISMLLLTTSMTAFGKECFLRYYEAQTVRDIGEGIGRPNAAKKCILSLYRNGNELSVEVYTSIYADETPSSVLSGRKYSYSAVSVGELVPGVLRNRKIPSGSSFFAEYLPNGYLRLEEVFSLKDAVSYTLHRSISLKLNSKFELDKSALMTNHYKMTENGRDYKVTNIECSNFKLIPKKELENEYNNSLLCY